MVYLAFEEAKFHSTAEAPNARHVCFRDSPEPANHSLQRLLVVPRAKLALAAKKLLMAHRGGKTFHSRPQKQDQNSSGEQLEDEEEEEDPYDVRIKKSGCSQFHYALQVRKFIHLMTPA